MKPKTIDDGRSCLVLTRAVGDSFDVVAGGERITVTITQQRGTQIRLAIEATPKVQIIREELKENP